MRTARTASVQVTAELLAAAQAVLEPGETLSDFVEQALLYSIVRRRHQTRFVARGLASQGDAKSSHEYINSDDVLAELDEILRRSIEPFGD